MNKATLLRFGLPIGGALAVAFAAIAVTASAAGVNVNLGRTPAPATRTVSSPGIGTEAGKADIAAYCSTFMTDFATNLGSTPALVDAAAKKALTDTIKKAVSDGKLTADQAAKMTAAIPAGTVCAAVASGGPGPGGPGGFGGGPGHGPGPGAGAGRPGAGELGPYLNAYMDAAAKAAGLGGAADLKVAPNAGKSLSEIAKAHNVDEATFRKNLIANLTPALDSAVAGGKLTADHEKAILAMIQSGPIPFWSGKPHPMGPPPSGAPVSPPA